LLPFGTVTPSLDLHRWAVAVPIPRTLDISTKVLDGLVKIKSCSSVSLWNFINPPNFI